MDNPPLLQLWDFTLSVLFGGLWAGFYGICGVMRISAGVKRLFLADALFWFVSLPALVLFLFFLNGGDVRGYVLAGISGGFLLVSLIFGGIFAGFARLWTSRMKKKKTKK